MVVLSGPGEVALMERICADIKAFEREVFGNAETTGLSIMLGSFITAELWKRRKENAQWHDLDIEAVVDHFRATPPDLCTSLNATLMALLNWLAHSGRLTHLSAEAMLARLKTSAPPEFKRLQAKIASLPPAELAEIEQGRLERVARMLQRTSDEPPPE